MALIICPECGREVSDTAKQCVHCGYRFPQKWHVEMSAVKEFFMDGKRIKIIATIVCVVLAIILLKKITSNYNTTPSLFDRITTETTAEEVYEIFRGRGVDWFGAQCYYDVEFCGLKGRLDIYFHKNQKGEPTEVCLMEWHYRLNEEDGISADDDRFDEFWEEVSEEFTDKFGQPIYEYVYPALIAWKNEKGDTYTLEKIDIEGSSGVQEIVVSMDE